MTRRARHRRPELRASAGLKMGVRSADQGAVWADFE